MVSDTKSLAYRDGQAYYAALKSVMTHGGRVVKPKNLPDLVRVMEKEAVTNFEVVFASSFAIMYEKNRYATSMARIARMKHSQQQANNLRNNKKLIKIKLSQAVDKDDTASSTTETDSAAVKDGDDVKDSALTAAAASGAKITKDNTIPECMLASTCNAIKLAAILHVHNSEHMQLFMLSVYNDKSAATRTVADTLALSHKSVGELKEFINGVNNLQTTFEDRRGLVHGLLTLSNAFKLPACSRLAMDISNSGYLSIVNSFLKMGDRNPITSSAAYDPIISKFIKDSVPRVMQAEERLSIAKQMQVNVSSTISNILKSLRKQQEATSASGNSNYVDLDPNLDYEYYRGSTNYTRDIITTYCMHEGRRYRILTYNDCLYDVIGYSVENTDSKGQRNHDCEMFDRLKWSERLNLLDHFTTVNLKSAKGSELIDLLTIDPTATVSSPSSDSGNDSSDTIKSEKKKSNVGLSALGGDVTITWLNEKQLLCSKTLPIKKSKKKLTSKSQNQQAATSHNTNAHANNNNSDAASNNNSTTQNSQSQAVEEDNFENNPNNNITDEHMYDPEY